MIGLDKMSTKTEHESDQRPISLRLGSPIPLPPSPPGPPNGGTTAWLQVLAAFLLFFNSWGIVNTFGVFQSYYKDTFLADSSPSDISWIGTVQAFLLIVIGVLSGPLYDLGYLKCLIAGGTALIFLGLMIVSKVESYVGIFISLSLLVGLGAGCFFVPSVAIVATYFTSRRPFATGVAASGGSLGGVVFPILFKSLLTHVGYGWTCRIMGIIVVVLLTIAFFLVEPRGSSGTKRTLLDLKAFNDLPYTLFSLSLLFTFIGLYVPLFYIPSYSISELGVDGGLAFYLLAIMNAGSIFGRIIPNLLANTVGALPVLLTCNLICGILVFFWVLVHNLGGIISFGLLYGFFSGAVVSLPPSALIAISPDMSVVGTRLGMSFSFAGLGLLIGNPIAGALLSSKYQFVGLELFSGVMIVTGFILLAVTIWVHRTNKESWAQMEK